MRNDNFTRRLLHESREKPLIKRVYRNEGRTWREI